MESCEKHSYEHGVALCGRCGFSWCESCLVYAFGPKKPPYCKPCAMFAAGVRTSASRPALSRRELKARHKAVAAAPTTAAPGAFVNPGLAATGTEDAAPEGNDWDNPWWEESKSSAAR